MGNNSREVNRCPAPEMVIALQRSLGFYPLCNRKAHRRIEAGGDMITLVFQEVSPEAANGINQKFSIQRVKYSRN